MGMDDMYSEHVLPEAFVTEARQLLDDALASNAALQAALLDHDWCEHKRLSRDAARRSGTAGGEIRTRRTSRLARSDPQIFARAAQDSGGRPAGSSRRRAERKDRSQRRLADGFVAGSVDAGEVIVGQRRRLAKGHLAYPRHYSVASMWRFVMGSGLLQASYTRAPSKVCAPHCTA